MARSYPLAYFVASMMAGGYVGLGIILAFTLGSAADPAYQKLMMGAAFGGLALTLIVFAGSELFTGQTMILPMGWLKKRVTMYDIGQVWALSWLGNLIGCVALALVFVIGGGGSLLHEGAPMLQKIAAAKMHVPPIALLARAILCNWLVCLAFWMSARTKSDAAKLIQFFWCLVAFIASGFEHSIANMALFSIALLAPHTEMVSLTGAAYNLFWVTIGNTIGGMLLMAGGYWFISKPDKGLPILFEI